LLQILLVEDDPDVRSSVGRTLSEAGHAVQMAGDGVMALELISRANFALLITDVRLPKLDGLAVFRAARQRAPRMRTILMTSYGEIAEAVAAIKEGAHDYLTKPFDEEDLLTRVAAVAQQCALERELERARSVPADGADPAIVGSSPAIAKVLERLAAVADSGAPVLITGESGTGKELVARRLHRHSPRASGPFIAVNCAAFPDTLLEAELFGHERGAFTGAVRKRDGRFKAADGGTLFLDEVAEMSPSAQAKLLRAVQEGVVQPLGTNVSVQVDVRIVSATHRDLRAAIAEQHFRADLFYRLNGMALHLPALRDRPEDLPLLVHHLLARLLPSVAKAPDISLAAWRALSMYPFPGNVRELAHALQHAVILARGRPIDIDHLPEEIAKQAVAEVPEPKALTPLSAVVRQAEREHLLKMLAMARGKRSRAAELLGISRKNLWEKLRAHGISENDESEPLS
jgi:DNA-binding NtrC family response regulator